MNGDGHIGLIPANYVESVSSTSNVPFRAVALHVYNSEGGEELSFLEGQVLDIIQRLVNFRLEVQICRGEPVFFGPFSLVINFIYLLQSPKAEYILEDSVNCYVLRIQALLNMGWRIIAVCLCILHFK